MKSLPEVTIGLAAGLFNKIIQKLITRIEGASPTSYSSGVGKVNPYPGVLTFFYKDQVLSITLPGVSL